MGQTVRIVGTIDCGKYGVAEIVEGFVFPRERGQASNAKYPWHEWEDGQTRLIKPGEDFTCMVLSMDGILRAHAKSHHLKVEISAQKDEGGVWTGLYFRFSPKGPTE